MLDANLARFTTFAAAWSMGISSLTTTCEGLRIALLRLHWTPYEPYIATVLISWMLRALRGRIVCYWKSLRLRRRLPPGRCPSKGHFVETPGVLAILGLHLRRPIDAPAGQP